MGIESWPSSDGRNSFKIRRIFDRLHKRDGDSTQSYSNDDAEVPEAGRTGIVEENLSMVEAQDLDEKTLSRERIEGLCATAYAGG